MSIFDDLDERFDCLVDEVVGKLEAKGSASFHKSNDDIVYDRVGVFVENMSIRHLIFFLLHNASIDENGYESHKEHADKVRAELMNAKWNIQDLIVEIVKERL